MRNDTPQQLDPLGGMTARLFVIGAAVVALVVAVTLSLSTLDQLANPWLEIAALVAITAAGGYYVRAASPFRAPFPRSAYLTVNLLGLAAIALESAAQWGSNEIVRDDWAPIAFAVLGLTFGSWRPGWEIAVGTVVAALFVATLAFVQADTFAADVPALVFAILPATPILATGAAASAFSRSLVGSLLDWRSTAGGPATSDTGVSEGGVSARASHLVHLEDHVYPFLERVADGAEVSADDGDRARVLARELRTLLVLDGERSWLSRIVRHTDDPHRLAERMSEAERGLVRSLVTHVRNNTAFDHERMRLTLRGDEWEASCSIEVPCDAAHNPRVQLAPYVAVARSVFGTVSWHIAHNAMTIMLTFDPSTTGSTTR
jgi:hypothetical protein